VIVRACRRRAFSLGAGAAPLLAAVALLSSCGGSGKGLIPTGNAGPLQSDFEAVARAAKEGNGSCTETEAAIQKTEQDFNSLPLVVDPGLRRRLREGIANLRARSLALCAEPLPQATTETSTPTETGTESTPTQPQTPTQTGTATTPETPRPGGGTEGPTEDSQPPAEGEAEGGGEPHGAGAGK